MGFDLKSGNSALAFKEMGASPNKGIFSKKEKAEPAAALTRPSSAKFASPSKMDMSSMMSMAKGAKGGGGGGSSKDEPVKPPTIQGAQI